MRSQLKDEQVRELGERGDHVRQADESPEQPDIRRGGQNDQQQVDEGREALQREAGEQAAGSGSLLPEIQGDRGVNDASA